MAASFEKVHAEATREAVRGARDHSGLLRNLDPRQRKALTLFQRSREATAKDIAVLFNIKPRAAAILCQRWTATGFLEVANASNRSRRYRLSPEYEAIVGETKIDKFI
jgi:hypothetical protein